MKFSTLSILSDENISPKVVAFLRQCGLDVLDTKVQQWYGKDDDELLDTANREQRFILTHDSDFGTLVINENKACYGIIYLRVKNQRLYNLIRICKQLLLLYADFLQGTVCIEY
jgi:predicted nuclease of predicted toxin-antitoxin system